MAEESSFSPSEFQVQVDEFPPIFPSITEFDDVANAMIMEELLDDGIEEMFLHTLLGNYFSTYSSSEDEASLSSTPPRSLPNSSPFLDIDRMLEGERDQLRDYSQELEEEEEGLDVDSEFFSAMEDLGDEGYSISSYPKWQMKIGA
tara:strand:- start:1013 stop:1450 length:438 start_codon:yes stop_codon:yes gene_type:complete